MTEKPDARRLLSSTFDLMDEIGSLMLGAEMACADLDNETERSAIREVIRAARTRLDDVADTIEAARNLMRADQ